MAASVVAISIGLTVAPVASADDFGSDGTDPSAPGPVVVSTVDPSDNVSDAASTACGTFAQVLDGSSNYYGDFADGLEGSDYSDPAVEAASLTLSDGSTVDTTTGPGADGSVPSDPKSSAEATGATVKPMEIATTDTAIIRSRT